MQPGKGKAISLDGDLAAAGKGTGTTPAQGTPAGRLDRLDALRGFALVWMAGFHFCFDLANERLIDANFYTDTLWTLQRTCILSLFLLCAGAGQAVASDQGQSWARFWRRWAQIVGCAVLVSAGSALMFPHSWISFGVLHGMAVMLIVARLTAGWGAWLWPLGALAVLLPWLQAQPGLTAAIPREELDRMASSFAWLPTRELAALTAPATPLVPLPKVTAPALAFAPLAQNVLITR